MVLVVMHWHPKFLWFGCVWKVSATECFCNNDIIVCALKVSESPEQT